MRIALLLVLLVALNYSGLAQPGRFRIDSVPTGSLTPRVAFRWHAGDNPAWAAPTFDDSRWDTVKTTRSIDRLPQVAKAGISWFRLTIDLDSSVANRPLPLFVFQNGAAELYIDGKPFTKLGVVGTSAKNTVKHKRVRGEMYTFPALPAGPHVLAVRFATYPNPWYVPQYIEKQPVFSIEFESPTGFAVSIADNIHSSSLQAYLTLGMFLMLAAIHFLYYIYRRQSINLIFGTTMFLFCLGTIANDLPNYVYSLTLASWADYLGTLLSTGFAVMLLATYYSYLQQKRGLIFGLLAGFALFTALITYVPMQIRWVTVALGFIRGSASFLLFLDGFRITLIAIRDKRYNAVLVLISVSVLIVVLIVGFGIVGILSMKKIIPDGNILLIFGTIMSISIPTVLAILLAKEHDQTNDALQSRLAEVEKLSTEKESILTQQKELLEQQVARRTAKLNQSLQNLRETQTQLVQREKMASLGELTAGIAHEIQNPLNFVNNFAEVSTELLDELKQEQARPNEERDLELEAELLGDVHQNVSKISHHGQRAASIVKGMLQHSRATNGDKEQTDLNALGDEYLRLSYHGLRAKDKAFNATLHTSLDPLLEPVMVVSQDVGRVLLNLFNNAFYAVREKAKANPTGYFPTVWFVTKQHADGIELRIQDNGNGIPEELQRKIFQPFFTTKPTGEGTGLGLSLSFDIITKGHGGTLDVETTPGEQTTFIIRLPV
ncbi:ATP-binding protein [Fibrella aquatica]|uniref:ATP-binding protein n=1 Tax=Fibrella aquatica TaxID=3242487 RepID=UPI00351FBE7B